MVVTGCGAAEEATSAPSVPTAEEATSTPAGSDVVPSLTVETLKNASYLGIYTDAVQLTDGKYEGEPFVEGGASRPTVAFADITAFGDLDEDGVEDAVVVLVEDSGGSGSFSYLAAVLNRNGTPENVATQLVGDREQIQSVTIDGAEVTVSALVHGPDDPACCPSQEATLTYRFDGEHLVESPAED
jgi:hypothetical protein